MSKHCTYCNNHDDRHGHDHHGEKNSRQIIIRLVLSAILWAVAIFYLEGQQQLVLLSITYVISAYDVLFDAFDNLMHLRFSEETLLMSVASIAAFFINEGSEGVMVMLLYQLGELLSDLAVDRSKGSISDLLSKHPKTVHWLLDGELIETKTEKVIPGMILQIRPGEEIPVDGIIKEGSTSLDLSSINGESTAVMAEPGQEVLSGSINLTSLINIEATESLENSTVSKIALLVEECRMEKSKTEGIVEKFSRYYTPSVMILAVALAAFAPMVTELSYYESVKMACTLLVISCPCALVISIPLAFFCGVGRASQKGVLVKGAEYLEALEDFDYLALDKTGTLTTGEFKVVDINSNIKEEEFLKIAASIERNSNHPLAQAIVEAYADKEYKIVHKFHEEAGLGVRAKVGENEYYLGNYRYLKKLKLKGIKELDQTAVYMATKDRYIGNIVFADSIKEEAASVLNELRNMGVKQTIILSGDKQGKAEQLKETLSLDEVYGNLMPEDKVEHVRAVRTKGHNVAYVGDGSNDGAVLAIANVGITMGIKGTDLAIASSDVVLMHDNLRALADGRRVAQQTLAIVKQNLLFIIGCKLLFIVLGVLQLIPMWAAVFADVGVTLLAVLNSIKLFRMP